MIAEEKKVTFTNYLKKFTSLFEDGFNKELATQLKPELNSFDKEEAIELWVELLKTNCPVEKIDSNTYEVHDIINFSGNGDFSEYIHTVKLKDSDDTASVFMKFYFVFYCLTNNVKSNSYKIS